MTLRERMAETILVSIYDGDRSYIDVCLDCADAVLKMPEMEKIRRSLSKVMNVIECTYGHDDDGNRDEDLSSEYSGADIVEKISEIEGSVEDAIELFGGTVETDDEDDDDDEEETMVCDLCGAVEDETDAISSGWIADYYDGETYHADPVCVDCCASKITTNDDGENLLIKVAH